MQINDLEKYPGDGAVNIKEKIPGESVEAVLARIKRLISYQELQNALGLSRTSMLEWERKRWLPPSIKLGGSRFFDPCDIHEWLEARKG